MNDIKVIKKDKTIEDFNSTKIKVAVTKSADRVLVKLKDDDLDKIVEFVLNKIKEQEKKEIDIYEIHKFVELALDKISPKTAKSYRDFRNFKMEEKKMLKEINNYAESLDNIADVSNANTDSTLVSTKRSLILGKLREKQYEEYFLTKEEKEAQKDGFIYIHDRSGRLDFPFNCCLFDMENVLKGGFEMGNIWYNEPNSLDTAFDVLSDVTLSAASQEYGGFTIPEIDKILSYYAKKSYDKYYKEYLDIIGQVKETPFSPGDLINADDYVLKKVKREAEQGYQGLEYKFNTVASSRGDYPFITITFGLGTDKLSKLITTTILEVHMKGQGKTGQKRPVLFPKLVFLYDKELHGSDKENEDVFNKAIICSSKTMYPDYLSLTGNGYVSEMYKKYKRVVSPMGK